MGKEYVMLLYHLKEKKLEDTDHLLCSVLDYKTVNSVDLRDDLFCKIMEHTLSPTFLQVP